MIFEYPYIFGILDRNTLPYMIALSFDLAAQNLLTAVLGLIFNVSKNGRSDFLALGFFSVTDWLGDIGLLSINP